MTLVDKKPRISEQREIGSAKQKIELPKSVVDLAIKDVKNIKWTKTKFDQDSAEFPKRNSRGAKRKVVRFDDQDIGILQGLRGAADDGDFHAVRVQLQKVRRWEICFPDQIINRTNRTRLIILIVRAGSEMSAKWIGVIEVKGSLFLTRGGEPILPVRHLLAQRFQRRQMDFVGVDQEMVSSRKMRGKCL